MKKVTCRIIAFLISLCILTSTGLSANAMDMDISFGVDVSEWNSSVDYDKVKSDGNKFVMIRLGYGTSHLDQYFWSNIKAACEAGLDYGIYFYSYAYNAYEAGQEADFVIETLSQLGDYAKNFTLPLAYDLEDSQISDRCNKTEITKIMTTFLDVIEDAGYVPMIYANQNWYLNHIDLNTVVSKKYKIWYAYYNGTPNTSSQIEIGKTGVKPDMWQYYGVDTASPTVFDKNVIYYTDSLLKPLSCYHNYKETVVKATVTKNGSIKRECINCGNTVTSSIIPKVSDIKLSQTSFEYNGKVQKPTVTVADSNGNKLAQNKDFKVTYSNTNSTNAGEYTLTVQLIGDKYEGSGKYKYNIADVDRWIKSGNRWWYRHADGSYSKNNWEKIGGVWYHFDNSGWMQTGWLKVNNKWYYMNSSGAMQIGWIKLNNKWYYLNNSGAMQTGWLKNNNKWYYLNTGGDMAIGWKKVNNKWYYFNTSGVMLTGKQKIGNTWYYFNSNGEWIK